MMNALITYATIQILFGMTAKVTFLIFLALGTMHLIRKVPATTRYWLWSMVMMSAVLIPMLIVLSLFWPNLLLASPLEGSVFPPNVMQLNPPDQLIPQSQYLTPRLSLSSVAGNRNVSVEPISDILARFPWFPSAVFLCIWLGGIGIALGRYAGRVHSLRQIIQISEAITDPMWQALLAQSQKKLKVNRKITIIKSSQVPVPMTWGFLYPVIIIPYHQIDVPLAQREVILLHEIAHIERQDYLGIWLTIFSSAIHWFNPLIWRAARRMALEREKACDDQVLTTGISASEYASNLLTIARTARQHEGVSSIALAMAESSHLRERIQYLLIAYKDYSKMSGKHKLRWALLSMLVIVPLSVIQILPAPPQSSESPTKIVQRIGILAGHSGIASYGPTKGNKDPGAVCADGFTEGDAVMKVAIQTAALLKQRGFSAEILEEWDLKLNSYQADTFISLHADSCENQGKLGGGFRIGYPVEARLAHDKDVALAQCMVGQYEHVTGIPLNLNAASDLLTHYYAFSSIAPSTPGIIMELGSLYYDRDMLQNHPDSVAEGVEAGILCYLNPSTNPRETVTPLVTSF